MYPAPVGSVVTRHPYSAKSAQYSGKHNKPGKRRECFKAFAFEGVWFGKRLRLSAFAFESVYASSRLLSSDDIYQANHDETPDLF